VTSKSGRNAVNDIIEEIKARMRAGDPSMPLIGFDAETFVAQEQKNYKPKFVVDAWVTREACSAYLNGDLNLDELAAGDIPKKKKSRKK
jgi:hypothetical protein